MTHAITTVSTLLRTTSLYSNSSIDTIGNLLSQVTSGTTYSYRLNQLEGSGITTLLNKGKCPGCSKSQTELIETLPVTVQEEGCEGHCTPLPEKFLLYVTGT